MTSNEADTGPETSWTRGRKLGVGTTCDHRAADSSRVWFTLGDGGVTEPRFPRVDVMNLRTLEFVVAASDGEYVERTYDESRRDGDAESLVRTTTRTDERALVFEQRIREGGRESDASDRGWTLTAEYVVGSDAEAIVCDVAFEADDGNAYDVYVVADLALANYAGEDVGRVSPTAEGPVPVAHSDAGADSGVVVSPDAPFRNVSLAMASDGGFERAKATMRGDDLREAVRATGDRSEVSGDQSEATGNVVLVGCLAASVREASDVLSVGFAEGTDAAAAREVANGALETGYEAVRRAYVESWHRYLEGVDVAESVRDDAALRSQYETAAMVLKAVEDKTHAGAGVASPSVPWGDGVDASRPKDFGYSYVWARDLYQVFTAFSAFGDVRSAREAVEYVYEYQQREDGFVPQNTFVDGRTRWSGEQLDNVSFPAVMAYQLRERHGVEFGDVSYDYENVGRSADYVVRSGPRTEQERWEEEGGYSPSTLAAEIAGLVCAARLAKAAGAAADALVFLAVADEWAERTAGWTATEVGTSDHERTPYYVRVSDAGDPDDGTRRTLANGGPTLDERAVVDAGFLELVRLGVVPWDDEVVRNSLAEVDESIRVETPHGPAFYRYVGDGYGEQSDDPDGEHLAGGPWSLDHDGRGRLWPILTGERGEYELLSESDSGSDETAPENLLETMAGFANSGEMLPEQVWDQPEGTSYGWEFGEGTSAATPLAWSMAQFVRLAHSVDAGVPVETPAVVADRYLEPSAEPAPELSVEFERSDGTVAVRGRTDGSSVALRSESGARLLERDETGAFAATVHLEPGENTLVVAAGTGAGPVERVGTAVERRQFVAPE